jgi:O-acetyl-ADP-ribose deacetylase (regulator of RNase III)
MEAHVEGRHLALTRGDITGATVDAIVNAANTHLSGGGGVDGAIHREGGPEIMRECRRLGGCPTGDAVATCAGRLRARHVIHAVAPVWHGGKSGEPSHLRSAYRRSFEIASDLGDRTIAFPSLGTGAYGYPVEDASAVALSTALDFLAEHTSIDDVTFYLFSESDLRAYTRTLLRLTAS